VSEITVRRVTPEAAAMLEPWAVQRDVCEQIGPRIIAQHSSLIGDKRYVHVSGATLLAGMFGYHVREVGVERIEVDGVGAWQATCEIVRDGVVVGRGSAICMDDEKLWSQRPQFARRAMASTRAAGRALRLLFGHMLPMLGRNIATVTREEMPDER
jgi:hypothetical protein